MTQNLNDNLSILFIGFYLVYFIYIFINAFFQVRQVRILQKKVETSFDPTLRMYSILYSIGHILFFLMGLVVLFLL